MSNNTGLNQLLKPSEELAKVVGSEPDTRPNVVTKLWGYIKSHGLQDAQQKRVINADDNLRRVLQKDSVDMFELQKLITPHLTKV